MLGLCQLAHGVDFHSTEVANSMILAACLIFGTRLEISLTSFGFDDPQDWLRTLSYLWDKWQRTVSLSEEFPG